MVRPKDSFLIDTAFMIERTQKTFFETPLLTLDSKDHTFTFGFARDFLRMRRRPVLDRSTDGYNATASSGGKVSNAVRVAGAFSEAGRKKWLCYAWGQAEVY